MPRLSGSHTTLLLILTIVLGGMALAAIDLGAQSLWLDEAYTWWASTMPVSKLLQAIRLTGVHPPLYFLSVRASLPETSPSEANLRLISIVSHGLSIAVVAWIGWLVGKAPGAVAAAAFWSLHPFSLWYAREARPYALGVALSALAVAAFLAARRGGSRIVWGSVLSHCRWPSSHITSPLSYLWHLF